MTVQAPSRHDPVVRGASTLVGGPRGTHATGRASRWWTPLRILLAVTLLTSVVGFLAKSPCRTNPWSGEYQYTRTCYTDVFALYYSEGLVGDGHSRIAVPYLDHPVEYPPIIGGLMWVAAEVANVVHPHDPRTAAKGVPVDHRSLVFFDVTALLLTAFALLATWAVARLAGRERIWDAAMFALAPGLFLHAFTNWDLAAVAFAMAGLWAWSRRSPVVAGALLGLGIATKLYPLLLLLALLLLCFRSRRLREWLSCAATAVVTTVLCYLPAIVLSAHTSPRLRSTVFQFPTQSGCPTHYLAGWRWFWTVNTTRPADWDSLWFQLQHLQGHPLDQAQCGAAPVWLNFWVAIATVTVMGAVSLLVLAAPRRPRVAQVAFLLVAGFLLVNKVFSPQYVLWLIPLAVLARPRWRAFLAWQVTEVAVLVSRFDYFVGNDHPGQGAPIEAYFTAVLLRDLALAVLMGLVVHDMLRPAADVVRATGRDDPAGGVLEDAPDRWARPAARPPAGAAALA
ncbi:MAG TPA: glycosyltransferase 87 family protein [Mycobacteriales bacterium]|nr:glycosyltransferase 87 family protein [Mycobacteriales bacterium]